MTEDGAAAREGVWLPGLERVAGTRTVPDEVRASGAGSNYGADRQKSFPRLLDPRELVVYGPLPAPVDDAVDS